MTRAEAHIWIATYAARLAQNDDPSGAMDMADFAVRAVREQEPETLIKLNEALASGGEHKRQTTEE